MRSALIGAIWTTLLVGSNGLVYLAGPKIEQVSGNGFPPEQFIAILLSLGCSAGWMIALRRAAGSWAMLMSDTARIKASLMGFIVGVGLILWAFGISNHYQELFHDLHRREMPTQHVFTYWAITWQFWAGMGCVVISTGIWLGEKRTGHKSAETRR